MRSALGSNACQFKQIKCSSTAGQKSIQVPWARAPPLLDPNVVDVRSLPGEAWPETHPNGSGASIVRRRSLILPCPPNLTATEWARDEVEEVVTENCSLSFLQYFPVQEPSPGPCGVLGRLRTAVLL